MNSKKKSIPFIPNHILTEIALALVFVGVIFILASLYPRELGAPANPQKTPAHILPEWYFLWMYEMLKKLPKLLGILAPVLVFLALFAIPWLDKSDKRRPQQRPISSTIFALVFVVAIIFTFMVLLE